MISPKIKIGKPFFLLLAISALLRIAYAYAFEGWRDGLWISFAFAWPLWTTYALVYDKDIVAPFNWDNGTNQPIRFAYAVVSWAGYIAIMLQ